MNQQITNAGKVALTAAGMSIVLVTLGKAALFLKNNGSIVSTALLSGVAAAGAPPLSKYLLNYYPLNQERVTAAKRQPGIRRRPDEDETVNVIIRAFATGTASFLATMFLVNRVTNFISGYQLSIPKRVGLGLVSGILSGLAYLEAENELEYRAHARAGILSGLAYLEAYLEAENELEYRAHARGGGEASVRPHLKNHLKSHLESQEIHFKEKLPVILNALNEQNIFIDEASVAGLLSQLNDSAIIDLLNNFYTHISWSQVPWVHPYHSSDIIFSPFIILAHFNDKEQRDRIFKQVEFMRDTMECYRRPEASDKIAPMLECLRNRYNAQVFAMFFAQFNEAERNEFITQFDNLRLKDITGKLITSEDINSLMAPGKKEVPLLSLQHDGKIALRAGGGASVITAATITALILATRLAKGIWSNYPTFRGVVPAAVTTTVGFLVGKIIAENTSLLNKVGINKEDYALKIGYIGALALGILGTPTAAKYIFKGQQVSYWHGAGFTVAGVLAQYLAWNWG